MKNSHVFFNYMLKYNRGIDQFLYENIDYKTYDKVCYSIKGKKDKFL